MVCGPTARLPVVNVATPAANAPVPSVVPPSTKSTTPLGVPALDVTVAVKVTTSPKTDGLCEDASAVVVLAWPTTCATVFDVLPETLPSPAYTALIVCVPTARLLVVSV